MGYSPWGLKESDTTEHGTGGGTPNHLSKSCEDHAPLGSPFQNELAISMCFRLATVF